MKGRPQKSTAFWAGYISGQNGEGGTNPYKAGTDDDAEWKRGERAGAQRRLDLLRSRTTDAELVRP